MYDGKRILSLIGARGDSKGLPGKNIIDLNGKPLISWTIEAAKNCKYIDRTIVSTDSEKIAKVAKDFGAEVPFMRPKEMATDNSSINDYIRHAIDWAKDNDSFEYLVMMQPTSPLRNSSHLSEAIEYFFKNTSSNKDKLVSVSRAPQKVGWLLQSFDKKHVEFCFDVQKNNPRRQDLPDYYLPNGAIFITHINEFRDTFYTNETFFFEMDDVSSMDVDTLADLEKVKSNFSTLQSQ